MTVDLSWVIAILTIILSIGAIVAVYVSMNNRITVVETKMEQKTDFATVLTKLDDLKIAIGSMVKEEISHLKCQNCD